MNNNNIILNAHYYLNSDGTERRGTSKENEKRTNNKGNKKTKKDNRNMPGNNII